MKTKSWTNKKGEKVSVIVWTTNDNRDVYVLKGPSELQDSLEHVKGNLFQFEGRPAIYELGTDIDTTSENPYLPMKVVGITDLLRQEKELGIHVGKSDG